MGAFTMLKKAKAEFADENADDGAREMPQGMRESSRQIWLAGLGAFSRVQAEGAKVFEALVRQGEAIESKTRRAAVDTAAAARGAATATVREMKDGVGGTWDKLEQVFEDRVARALGKLGVHTQSDVERLAQRVDVLSEAVNQLIKTTGSKSSAPGTAGGRKPRVTRDAAGTARKTLKKTAGAGRKSAKPAAK
jgi:poly(hydroxyalkanoate) granule-associated protein